MLKRVQHDVIETLIRRLMPPLRAARKYLAAVFGDADAVFELRAQ
jgi:hypothetical protein